jgi:hypothetical protein
MVGGMRALVADRLTHESGRVWEAGGVLVDPANLIPGIADAIQYVLSDADAYQTMAVNARGRVEGFFQLRDAMALYNRLYRRLAKLPPAPVGAPSPLPAAAAPIPAPARGRAHVGPYRGRARVPHAIRPIPRVPSHAAAIGIATVPSRPHAGAYVIHRAPTQHPALAAHPHPALAGHPGLAGHPALAAHSPPALAAHPALVPAPARGPEPAGSDGDGRSARR